MKENIYLYLCKDCNNIIEVIDGKADSLTCCGKMMEKLTANTTDAAVEKHLPVYEKVEDELLVKVGEIEHPMQKDHYIMWIALVTDSKMVRVKLYPEQSTETRFPYIKGAELYAYCNKHGLWKTTIE